MQLSLRASRRHTCGVNLKKEKMQRVSMDVAMITKKKKQNMTGKKKKKDKKHGFETIVKDDILPPPQKKTIVIFFDRERGVCNFVY